jgi:hypothetical protein
MTEHLWTWLVAGTLVLLLSGCASQRTQVATIAPTFSYVEATGTRDASAMWPDALRDSVSVQAALADR